MKIFQSSSASLCAIFAIASTVAVLVSATPVPSSSSSLSSVDSIDADQQLIAALNSGSDGQLYRRSPDPDPKKKKKKKKNKKKKKKKPENA